MPYMNRATCASLRLEFRKASKRRDETRARTRDLQRKGVNRLSFGVASITKQFCGLSDVALRGSAGIPPLPRRATYRTTNR